ncbi:MAG: hypothetical protein IH820_16145 [Bacteroidetes bacterium]|nr:hypothetical protein [Bacteroidota bacterium]
MKTATKKQTMPLAYAQRVAGRVVDLLAPYCERIEIAGSIRRERPHVSDVEIVCIPQTVEVPDGMFHTKRVCHPGFINQVNQWQKVKGVPTGKYTQRILPEGVQLDLFIASEDNWGLILAIRTGSARFSHQVLARSWVACGFHSKDGRLVRERTGFKPPIREEKDLFELIGLAWVEPRDRQ